MSMKEGVPVSAIVFEKGASILRGALGSLRRRPRMGGHWPGHPQRIETAKPALQEALVPLHRGRKDRQPCKPVYLLLFAVSLNGHGA